MPIVSQFYGVLIYIYKEIDGEIIKIDGLR